MVLLKQAISASPFFMLAFFLLIIGAASLLYKLISVTRAGNRKFGKPGEQNKGSRATSITYIVLLILVVIGVIFFINWLNKIKYD